MDRLTYNQFRNLSWLHFDRGSVRTLLLPSLQLFKNYIEGIPSYTGNIDEETLNSLFDFSETNLYNELIVAHYDGRRLIDISYEPQLDYMDYYIVDFFPKDNVIIITDELS